MQSSYSVIKSHSVLSGKEKTIMTEYNKKIEFADVNELIETSSDSGQEMIEKYRQMGDDIINSANEKRNEILSLANENAAQIEKDAYEKGYSQGQQNGYEDGYKEAYDKNIESAKLEASEIVNQAMNILKNARVEYEDYMKKKTQEIIHLSIKMAETVLKTKLEVPEGLNNIVQQAIESVESSKTFVIRCNEVHVDELKTEIEIWKTIHASENNIFVVGDNSIDPGNAVIERDNGKTEVGIETGLEKIKEAIL